MLFKKIALFFFLFNLFSLIEFINACTCVERSIFEMTNTETAIFECRALKSEYYNIKVSLSGGDTIYWPKIKYSCFITKCWKGSVRDTIDIISNSGSSVCGVDLENDSLYILSVTKSIDTKQYHASICGIYSLKSRGKKIVDSLNYYFRNTKDFN